MKQSECETTKRDGTNYQVPTQMNAAPHFKHLSLNCMEPHGTDKNICVDWIFNNISNGARHIYTTIFIFLSLA